MKTYEEMNEIKQRGFEKYSKASLYPSLWELTVAKNEEKHNIATAAKLINQEHRRGHTSDTMVAEERERHFQNNYPSKEFMGCGVASFG